MFTIPGKIPISIHPVFFLVTGLIGFMWTGNLFDALLVTLVIFFSVFVHELGHAFTAMSFGQTASIAFVTLGGLTYRKGPKLKLWQEFIVVLNGPVFGFILCLISAGLRYGFPDVWSREIILMLEASFFINAIWTVLNLIPVGPLDGGQLLGIVLQGIFGFRGMRWNFIIGTVLGVSIAALCFTYWKQPIMGFLFLLLTMESFRAWRGSTHMSPKDQDEDLQKLFRDGEKQYHAGNFDAAYGIFEEVRKETNRGFLFTGASEYLSRVLADQGEFEEAYEMLLPLEKQIHPESLRLLQRLAYYARDHKVVLRVGQTCFEQHPVYDVAFLNALSHALLGEARESVGWLKSARREGMPKLREAMEKREFDSIRHEQLFQDLLHSLDETP